MKFKVDDIRTAIRYIRPNNCSNWTSVRFEDGDKLVFMFEDKDRQTCEIMVYPGSQATTPKIKKISNLYDRKA